MIGKKCIFRCDRSGVFFGELVKIEGAVIEGKDVRKLYYWDGARCIEQLAMDGTLKPENCKFTRIVDSMVITDCLQVIPCSLTGILSIEGVLEWKL